MDDALIEGLRRHAEDLEATSVPATLAGVQARPVVDLGLTSADHGAAPLDTVADAAQPELCGTCGSDLTVFDLSEPGESPRRRPRKRRGAVVGLAATVLLVVGVVVMASRDDTNVETEPVASATTPDSVVSSSVTDSGVSKEGSEAAPSELTATPVSEPDPTGLRWCEAPSTWNRVCHDGPGFEGGEIRSITAGGPGLVAVGSDWDWGDPGAVYGDAAVWTSVDGLTWSRVPHDEAIFSGVGSYEMSSVTVGGPGLVAVGSAGGIVYDGDWVSAGDGEVSGDAAVWTSVDGLTWSRVPHDEAIFGGAGEQGMMSVTAGGPGLVAVGTDREAGEVSGDAAVWTSVDGLTWSRVPHDEAIFGGAGEQEMAGVTVGGPGLVAVGTDREGSPAPRGSGPWWEVSSDAAVWTSVDGLTWSRVRHDEAVFGGDGPHWMSSVTVGGPGLVAVGTAASAQFPETVDAAVWTSVDGFTWSRAPQDPAAFAAPRLWWGVEMASVTAGGPGLVAVGATGPIEGLHEEAIWTSPDGINWTLLPPSKHGCHAWASSVIDTGLGLVAAGHGGRECGSATAAIWHD